MSDNTSDTTQGLNVFQIEIRVRDLAAAMAFYRNVFAWGVYQSAPAYALVDTGRMPVVGILQDPRLPLGICPNILTDDCERSAQRAAELGGRIVVTKSEVANSGAYTGTLDPWGSEMFFWQPYVDGRPNLKAEPENPFVFLEIATPDIDKATGYYGDLMGWSFWSVAFANNYAIAEGCGLERGVGLFGSEGASGTTSYVKVSNLEQTAAKVTAAGGQILVGPADFPGEGRYIVMTDPDGNRLGALEVTYEPPKEPMN